MLGDVNYGLVDIDTEDLNYLVGKGKVTIIKEEKDENGNVISGTYEGYIKTFLRSNCGEEGQNYINDNGDRIGRLSFDNDNTEVEFVN